MAAFDPAPGSAAAGDVAGRNGQVFLVSAARTPIGRFGGVFADTPATTLGGVAIRAAVERSGLPEGAPVDEVLMGQVLQAGVGQAPARQAALAGGLPDSTSATTISSSGSTPSRGRRRRSGPGLATGPVSTRRT